MRAIEFPECNVVVGKDQPEYFPIPVYADKDGMVVMCWELNKEEIEELVKTNRLYVTVLTGNRPFQPIYGELENPFNKKTDGK